MMTSISDSELDRIGMLDNLDNAKQLYDIDESLLYIKPRKEKLVSESRSKKNDEGIYAKPSIPVVGGGSNCFAIHGSHTESGKPILSCDPHLAKLTQGFWYLTRIAWTAKDKNTGETYPTFSAGGTFVGIPTFIYARTPFASYGPTALNPDVMDVFVETVGEKDGRGWYFDAKDNTYKDYEIVEETIKVRFGSDVKLQIKHTANGVVLPHDLLDGEG